MKTSEIKSLTAEELEARINEETEALSKLKFAHEISPIENPMKIRESRRLIARLKTELRAKEIAK
ncbi:50S ribosomal protein L29 [Mangrovivirga sp. M17]|uniref:Large ribosomal subunit protein uL29 n=2 Tax=Mangrovivirga TaxID=2858886 RepID=A0A4D7JSX2_9BACT|nr:MULTISPECIES: 50S ribosomal protein L29 [Mangrovivirga]MCX2745034.1 50S ribosomal protein L29 [Mangrovivirga halotolerans]QCK14035.1 50S ribosomal protein L29 [Mangrovivirga cuniculi]